MIPYTAPGSHVIDVSLMLFHDLVFPWEIFHIIFLIKKAYFENIWEFFFL